MDQLLWYREAVFWVAALMAVVSFAMFVGLTLWTLRVTGGTLLDQTASDAIAGRNLAGATLPDLAELAKALATLAEALSKTGPALWALVTFLLFLAISGVAGGMLVSAPPSAPAGASVSSEQDAPVKAPAGGRDGTTAAPRNENLEVR